MNNKDRERKPIDVVLHSVSDFKGFIDVSENKQERPDFVFKKGDQIVGVEHIEIPILPMKGQSAEQFFNNKTRKLYQDWKDIFSSHYEEVTKAIQDLINQKLDVYSSFSSSEYIKSCARLLGAGKPPKRKHNASQYIELLKERYSGCDIKIAFVLDIGYSSADISKFQYCPYPGEKFYTQRRLDYPFTIVFLVLLALIVDVYDFYIVWHPYNDYESKYVKCYDIHFDENKQLLLNSNIPRVWWEFDMPEGLKHHKVKLNFEET